MRPLRLLTEPMLSVMASKSPPPTIELPTVRMRPAESEPSVLLRRPTHALSVQKRCPLRSWPVSR